MSAQQSPRRVGMKAADCYECQHFSTKPLFKGVEAVCAKEHSMRFYAPKSPLDRDWGWKRRCDDFLRKPGTNGGTAP